MKIVHSSRRAGINRGARLFLFLIFVLFILFLTPSGDSNSGLTARHPLPVQPLLLQIAAARPDQVMSVIVQKTTQDARVEEFVTNLGGKVTKNLRIINAFAAELRAGEVAALGGMSDVRWVSLDAPIARSTCSSCISTENLQNAYVHAVGADRLWNEDPYLQGQNVTVAVVDSGVAAHDDLNVAGQNVSRVQAFVLSNSNSSNVADWYGHGTHVAGVIGGNGKLSAGTYIGVAPQVNLVSVKVTDDQGAGRTSDVVAGLQWVYDNKSHYNIRVVNLSLNSSAPESYNTSPLDAALEILWFNNIVVVVSAGNSGSAGVLYPPSNDPFVISVGAADDRGTFDTLDDLFAPYSAFGVTTDGFAKPDLVAPGSNIVSLLASPRVTIYKEHPENRVENLWGGRDHYFRMSGTSMSSAVTAGAAALLLQANPNLNPDQVKYLLKATARPFNNGTGVGAGYLDVYAAVTAAAVGTENAGLPASQLLWTGSQPVVWGSVNWNSVNWNSVNWNSVNWNSVNWNSVNWNSDYWGP